MLARAHALLGVGLAIYLALHARALWPALAGREAWVERAVHGVPSALALGLAVILLGAHAGLGWLRFFGRSSDQAAPSGNALLRIQAATGVLVLFFVVYHLFQVWGSGTGPHRGVLFGYAAVRQALSRRLDVGIYLISISIVCFHLGHGLSRAVFTFGLAPTARATLWARLLSGALAFALWGAFLQVLGHFALGQPLVR